MKPLRCLLPAALALLAATPAAADGPPPFTPAEQAVLDLIPHRNVVNPTEVTVDQARAGVRARPRDADAWHQLGDSLDVAGRLAEAADAFDRATRLPPRIIGRAYLHRDLAETREKLGDVAGALAAARVMIRSWPLSRDGLHCSGFEVRLMVRLLVKSRDTAGAMAFYDPLYRANPAAYGCEDLHRALSAAAQ